MKGRTPTAEERRHMAAVAELGCVVCRIHLGVFSPACIHHTEGKTRPGAHLRVLPICGIHHTLGGHGVARHAGKAEWERRYGTEAELLEYVAAALARHEPGARINSERPPGRLEGPIVPGVVGE